MWLCPMCETSNDTPICVVCGEVKPSDDQIAKKDTYFMQDSDDILGGDAKKWNDLKEWGEYEGEDESREIERLGRGICITILVLLAVIIIISHTR